MIGKKWYSRLTPLQWLTIWCVLVTLWSVLGAADVGVWFFEIYTGFIALAVLWFTRKRFPLSNFLYVLIGIHYTVLAIGAHWTYAGMPLFNWLRDQGYFSRNMYDRVGHFFQGFVPAIAVREILLRRTRLQRGKMLNFIAVCIPLAFSAFWEILEEWIARIYYTSAGPEWLGWQGDIWDAQHDMTMCLIGATLAVLFLSKMHNRSMAKLIST